jgi:RNA polymerase sigma factor (sigma-70 family)
MHVCLQIMRRTIGRSKAKDAGSAQIPLRQKQKFLSSACHRTARKSRRLPSLHQPRERPLVGEILNSFDPVVCLPDDAADGVSAALEAHRPTLRRYFQRRIAPGRDAEDYVQEVYLRVLSAGPASGKIANLRGFLLRAASSVWIDRHRRARARIEQDVQTLTDELSQTITDPAAACPERTAIARDELRALSGAIETLPPVARQAFMLVRIEGMSHKEAARQLGLEPRQVAHHVERSLARLSRSLLEVSA